MLSKFFLLMLAAGSAHAESNDTYNFYFQKAPGPVTVNQGAAPAATTPDVKVKGDGTVVTPAAASVAATPAPSAEEHFSGQRRWELSAGISGTRSGGGGGDASSRYYYYYQPPTQSGMINAAQYYLGAQFNLSEVFALQADVYRLVKAPDDHGLAVRGSFWDYGANLVVTPFRWRVGDSAKITASLLVGAMSAPIATNFSYPDAKSSNASVQHSGSLVYGARAALELGNRFALQVSARKVDRFSSTQGIVSVGLLL